MSTSSIHFRRFQLAIETQSRVGGIVILGYHARTIAADFFTAIQHGCEEAFIALPEHQCINKNTIAPLLRSALLARGHLYLEGYSDSPRALARELARAHIRVLLIQRHRRVPTPMLLEFVSLVEAGRDEGHPIVIVLATSEAPNALTNREPALVAEASCIDVPSYSAVDVIEMLRHEGIDGPGLPAIARLSSGHLGVVKKLLTILRANNEIHDGRISRESVERNLLALNIANSRYTEEEWKLAFEN